MSELIGKELGLYQILEYISVGGMSTVYKGYHVALDRYVAIKVLPAQMGAGEQLRQRFLQEVRVFARLQHAHILPIFDYGQDDGHLYLVMRLIEHGSLADRLRLGSLDMGLISRVMHQVGGALSYAHSQGIVHRDVKPSNVLIDGQENCYLSDFGLAKTMQASNRFTATGVGLGTPAYMSPEQGKGEQVDARSDIYSLGAMLYEMVTGQVPYQADTPLAVMLKHVTEPLPLPSRIRPDISPALEQVIVISLSKAPGDRFQSIADMVDAFDGAVLQGSMPVVAPAPSPAPALPSTLPEPRAQPPLHSRRYGGEPTQLVFPPREGEPSSKLSTRRRLKLPSWRLIGAVLAFLAVLGVSIAMGTGTWAERRAALYATETALAGTQVALQQSLTSTALALARPTSTSTPSATATWTRPLPPTATPTGTATSTATAAATATVAETPTSTATATPVSSPTAAPTPTATPTQRPTATPTVRWLSAPVLLAPADGASFVGWSANVTLRWGRVEGLESGEYYVVRIPYDSLGGVAEFWRQETVLQLPPNFSLSDVGFSDRHYDWTVQVMLCHENCYKVWDDQAIKTGEPVGDESQPQRFYWHPDISGARTAQPTPTPTRHVPGG